MFSAFQTFGRLGAGARAVAAAWSPSALWPTGTEPGMWIDPSNLTSQWQDSTGTTPVATPGTVADSSNPVGLALDIRAGAPTTLGPELVVNGTFDTGIADWTADFLTPTLSWDSVNHRIAVTGNTYCTATTPFSVTAGKTYLLSATLAGTVPAIWFGTNGTTTVGAMLLSSGQSVYTAQSSGTLYAVIQGRGANGSTAYFDNISVKEIPGNHMLQATATARPLESARVNLFVYSEQMDSGEYLAVTGAAYLSDAVMSGYISAKRYEDSAGTSDIYFLQRYFSFIPNTTYFMSVDVQFDDNQPPAFGSNTGSSASNSFTVAINGTIVDPLAYQIVALGSGIYRVIVSINSGASIAANCGIYKYATNQSRSFVTSGWNLSVGSYSGYQKVIGDGSSYSPTGFPYYQQYDGTDDGMATAAFAAGTLSSNMDCLIAVRRDSAANAVCGLYESVSDANKVFGIAESGSSSGCVGSGAGTPTVWVDGVQLTGGTAVTRGTLHTALTVGDYHVLEFRGLDLSTWTASGFGLYTSYVLNGAQGGILLFPGGDTAGRDAARAWLAAKVGVTLP